MVGLFPKPVLRFKKGTTLFPANGFKYNLEPYSGPDRIRLGLMARRSLKKYALNLVRNIVFGIDGYKGMAKWFKTYIKFPPKTVFKEKYDEFDDGLEDLSDCDIVLIVIPDEKAYSYDEDPYMPLKQRAALLGLPTQMICESTLKYLRDRDYVLLNLALSIYSKVGGIPWIIGSKMFSKNFIGIDITRNGVAVFILHMGKKIFFDWRIHLSPTVEVIYGLDKIILDAFEILYKNCGEIDSIVIHRDGNIFEGEVEAIRNAISIGLSEDIFAENFSWHIVEVKKKIIPKIVGYRYGRLTNPEKGYFYKIDLYRYLITTSGFPEHPYIAESGLARPIIVELVDTSNWEIDMYMIARDIYWLSELHWASAFSSTRLPITTLYPHRICGFWSAGIYPSEKYYNKLWFL